MQLQAPSDYTTDDERRRSCRLGTACISTFITDTSCQASRIANGHSSGRGPSLSREKLANWQLNLTFRQRGEFTPWCRLHNLLSRQTATTHSDDDRCHQAECWKQGPRTSSTNWKG